MPANADVSVKLKELVAHYDEGLVAGYESGASALPGWWWDTPPGRMTPYQRGYFVGREVRYQEQHEGRKVNE